ncbi:MAG: ferric reductase-like transmembrane domain-containing protein [Balneolia bacterium]|nr:ferric reductase-like transmembrane domain-containing protein [Balneolia bacterium]
MRYSAGNGILWLCIYFVLALIPIGIALAGDLPELRSFWIEFGVALGFIGLAMFALQFLFSGRLRHIAPVFGNDNVLNFHRQVGITAFFLVLAHPVILLTADPAFWEYFDPRVNFMRAVSLSFVTIAIVMITVTSIWRINFRLQYEHWRLIHGLLAMAIVGIGTAHAIQVGHYLEPFWKKAALAILMGSVI